MQTEVWIQVAIPTILSPEIFCETSRGVVRALETDCKRTRTVLSVCRFFKCTVVISMSPPRFRLAMEMVAFVFLDVQTGISFWISCHGFSSSYSLCFGNL